MVVVPVPRPGLVGNDAFDPYAVSGMGTDGDRAFLSHLIHRRSRQAYWDATPGGEGEQPPAAIDEIPCHRNVGVDGSGHDQSRSRDETGGRQRFLLCSRRRQQQKTAHPTRERHTQAAEHPVLIP